MNNIQFVNAVVCCCGSRLMRPHVLAYPNLIWPANSIEVNA